MEIKTEVARKQLRVLGLIVGVFGVSAVWPMGVLIRSFAKNGIDWGEVAFLFMFPLWVFLFGFFCCYIAYRSWRFLSPRIVRYLSGTTVFILAVIFYASFLPLFGIASLPSLNVSVQSFLQDVAFIFTIISAVFAHRKISRRLIDITFPGESLPPLSKNTAGLILFLIWLSALKLINYFFSSFENEMFLFWVSAFLASTLLMWLGYRMVVKRLHCK